MGRLDLKTKLEDGTICQIEVQLSNLKNTIKRILYYWSRSYGEQIIRGEAYLDLKKTIGIVITDYELEELKGIEKLETKWQIMETNEGKKILTQDLELRIIEIPKARRIIEKEKTNKIAQWMMFLDNPNARGLNEIMEDNKELKEATNVLHEMSEDEELRRLAFLKERALRDERWERECAIIEGKEKGMEEGLKEGKKEGRKEGRREEKIEIAKKLLKKGMDIEEIIDITGLNKEDII